MPSFVFIAFFSLKKLNYLKTAMHILLKMTCTTFRDVYNNMLTDYGVSIILRFIKILFGCSNVCIISVNYKY